MFIYLDESGDFGFDFKKRTTTKKFIITLLVSNTEVARREIDKAVKRTLKNKLNRKKKKARIVSELKGTGTTIGIKKYFFRNIKNEQWSLYSLILNKLRVEKHLQTRIGTFIKGHLKKHLGDEGVHYSDLFEHYIYAVKDKPRRQLAEFVPDYFYKTDRGTWVFPPLRRRNMPSVRHGSRAGPEG